MLGSLSIRSRFLISPIIGVLLTLILYISSSHVLKSHVQLFNDISESNLPQISEISHITLLLSESNSEIISLLLETEGYDEEQIYVEGKKQLNNLYRIKEQFDQSINEDEQLIIENEDIFLAINSAFNDYITEASLSIEMSSVDAKQASYELLLANQKLKNLNQLFLQLSQHYSNNLTQQAKVLEGTLYQETYITELAIGLILLMIWSAYYFSKHASMGVTQVHTALIKLSKGNTNIEKYQNNDAYIKEIWDAVAQFKESIEESNRYQNELLIQKFAMDQHSIIATTDLEGSITYANDKFCELSGYSIDELIGKNHRILNSGNQRKTYWFNMFQTVSQGNVWHDEVLNKAKDGRKYWVDTTIIPMTSVEDKNKITGYISIRTDITEQKNQYQKLIDANSVAESAVIAKAQFLATMSHEIRTPMNGVIGMLDLVLSDELNSEQRQQLEVAHVSAKSLLTLINDILDFSKVDAGKLELESLDFNLHHFLNEFVETMQTQANDKNLLLQLNINALPNLFVLGDSGRIRQILTNLVGNAIKFTNHGSISIDADLKELSHDLWTFNCEITDTGVGIPAERLHDLFDSFSQVDASTTRKFGGSGLGLAISKRLTKLMKGNITVSSELNVGSCFKFSIPLRKSNKKIEKVKDRPTTIANLEIPKWPEELTILLVEDNRVNQLVILGILKQFNLSAELAVNGIDAINKIEQSSKPYDIILMDCQMPEMDGYKATEHIRKRQLADNLVNTPIIALTANAMSGDREKCLQVGMNDYLTKPIDPELLLEKLSYWLITKNPIE
jgi:PAS domain S-box-containing protein